MWIFNIRIVTLGLYLGWEESSMYSMVRRSVCLLLALGLGAAAMAVVPVTLPVDPEETVVTCFSGLAVPQPSTPPFPEDLDMPVVGLLDTRIPELATNPTPVNDTNWQPPMFENLSAPAVHRWTARNLGQVFGLTLDDQAAPNIYVSATSLYGATFASGPGGPGAVYRLDGVTGDICLLLILPNGGPALGQLAHDPASNHLFISNMEDGLIYSVSLSPINGNGCNISGQWTTFDHGVQARPNEGLGVMPDDGLNNTFTRLGRRVWGLCVFQSRLYYSVWWEDGGRQNSAEGNEIWSVQIDGTGNFLPATAIREFVLPQLTVGGTYSNPVSDIEFNASGEMLVAERTLQNDHANVDLGQNAAHASRVLKFAGASGGFTMYPDDTYRTGKIFGGTNSAGGVSSDCDENVWMQVDAIHYGGFTGDTDFVYGLQRTLAAGNASDATPTSNGYIIGLAPGYYKAQLGDVDYVRDCPIIGEGEGADEGEPEGEGQHEGCLEITNDHADCISDATGQSISYTFDLTNLSGLDAYWALITSQTPGVTITPNQVATFIPNGGTVNLTVTITGATPGKPICFTITLLDKTREVCCSETICIENPCDCAIIPVESQKLICDPTTPGSYSYTFSITNTSALTLEHAYLFPDGGGTFTPNYIALGSLAPGNTAGPFTVTLSGVQPGDYCFTITFHDKELRECCAFRHCIELPNCCDPDTTPPVITISGPTTVHCGEPGVYEVTAIDDCDGDVSQTLKKDGQVNWFANGTYCVTITAVDSSGNIATTVFCITVTGCDNAAGLRLSADPNGDQTIALTELLRVIQFYNVGGYHVDAFSEDGFAPGLDPESKGRHHTSDHINPNWIIELSELLRLIQFYNVGGYHPCADSEDGFCLGK